MCTWDRVGGKLVKTDCGRCDCRTCTHITTHTGTRNEFGRCSECGEPI